MKLDKLINELSHDTGVFFYTFEQDDGRVIAKSHFFDFYFHDDRVEIVDSYNSPGDTLKSYLDTHTPYMLHYNVDNFYQVLLEYVEMIHDDCIFLEQQEELDKER